MANAQARGQQRRFRSAADSGGETLSAQCGRSKSNSSKYPRMFPAATGAITSSRLQCFLTYAGIRWSGQGAEFRVRAPIATGQMMGRIVIALLQVYRYALSPLSGPCCRFHPSCSEYGVEAVTRYGCARGVWLTLRRLVRCHPWHRGGYDPVP